MESPEPSNLNTTSSKDASPQADDYDANGALQYIVATLCVYALVGILSLLLVRIVRRAKRRRRLYMRHEENQNVRLYVRNSNTIRLEGHRQVRMMEKMRTSLALWNKRHAPDSLERSVSRPDHSATTREQKPLRVIASCSTCNETSPPCASPAAYDGCHGNPCTNRDQCHDCQKPDGQEGETGCDSDTAKTADENYIESRLTS